ncbi:3-oxosteroid 1-dehydrogenase [Virgisporangium aurantiacum]|uniref:3-oxosteroid 1-dehydrogenase n=1 Tax=Virgisporangium aurantiacum TaxID=175570 RepID=A0A8J4E408_9ACTN|nr:3-oxosteroid 1-dehydrogenase [Virgisporangium aurantiacum]GIJ60671.1 3-ketosteroid-delta-1-dehydrogenase [Virgisporangium aurantiacum]
MAENEHEFDVVVVGSGAAGMTAALAARHHGLSVVVVEKAESFGGSTARSGGGLWIPGNEVLRRAGVTDNAEDAETYLAHVVGPDVPAAKRNAFLEHGPAMLSFVLAHSPARFAWVPGYADYYPEAPGGRPAGRTIEPRPFDGRALGAELRHLAPPYIAATDNVTVTARDYRWLSLGTRHPRAALAGARVAGRWLVSKALRRRSLGLGQALAAGLRVGLAEAGVPVWLGTAMTGLEYDGERVVGIRVADRVIRARRGVLLATGGFEHNEAMRRKYQREPIGTTWTVGAPGNVGDGITAAGDLGAALDLMDDAWWGPSLPLPSGPFFCLAERSLPGCLLVNAAGRRYVNEAAPYVDVVHAMYDNHSDEVSHIPSWLVFDQQYRDRYLFAGKPPRRPLPRRWYDAGIIHRSSTLDGLAAKVGLPALPDTVARFNTFAAGGHDEDFGKGDSAYDRYYGDPRNRPNPCLGPLVKPPFHAIQMVPGDLGTKGGLRTDERSRVLRADDTPIPGLYAAGNTSAAVMGHSYAGAGATIGPAMTFGYIAALDLANVPVTS